MSITAISSATSGSTVQSSASIDASIARLQKQVIQVQQQITAETASKDDAKTKAQLLATYVEEMTALQAQLAQLQAQKEQATQNAAKAQAATAQSATPAVPPTSRYFNGIA